MEVGAFARDFFIAEDVARIVISQRQARHASKEYRRRRRRRRGRLGREEEDAEREGVTYSTGGH